MDDTLLTCSEKAHQTGRPISEKRGDSGRAEGVAQRSIRGGGGGVSDPKFCVPKKADKIFPTVNFVFPHFGHFGLEGGGGEGGYRPPPAVYGHSDTALAEGVAPCFYDSGTVQ